MIIVIAVVAVLALGAGAALVLARGRAPGVPEPVSSLSAHALPDGVLTRADVDGVRFDQALRGYRMEQVDAALDRLANQLATQEAEISRLRADTPGLSGEAAR